MVLVMAFSALLGSPLRPALSGGLDGTGKARLFVVAENVAIPAGSQNLVALTTTLEAHRPIRRIEFTENLEPASGFLTKIWIRDAVKRGNWKLVPPSGEDLLAAPSSKIDVRITATVGLGVVNATIRLLTLATPATSLRTVLRPMDMKKSSAWGKQTDLQVSTLPLLSDSAGGVNAVSRLNQFWAKAILRPEFGLSPTQLAKTVGEHYTATQLAKSAGAGLGLRSYSSYFQAAADLDAWLNLEVPVICLQKMSAQSTLNYVILTGFKVNGDAALECLVKGAWQRITMPRVQFLQRWQLAERKVILTYPSALATPDEGAPSEVWVADHTDG